MFTAVLLTSVLAQLIVKYFSVSDINLLIAPIALLIGVVGDDWVKAFSWVLNIVKNAANSIINKKLGE